MMRGLNDGGTLHFVKPINIEFTPERPTGSVLLGMQPHFRINLYLCSVR